MTKVSQRGFDINDKKWFSNKEIIKLLKEEIPYTTVIITDSEIRITEDLYGFSVK